MKKVHLSRKSLLSVAAALTLVLSIFTANAVFGQSRAMVASAQKIPVTAHRVSNVATSVGHAFNISSLPKVASAAAKASNHSSPSFLGVSPKLAQAKASATHNSHAPAVAATASSAAQTTSSAASPALNTAFQFQGMQDSATICKYFGGCQPPDMAVASSPTKVLQVVNTSYQLFTTTGATIFGPIDAQVFNGVPDPSPAGCDTFGNGAFTSDPRAFYDPNTGFFFTAILQVEGAPGFGVAPNCNFVSKYWIAAINPNTLSVCVYNFNMSLDGVNAADYTQLGFNKDVVSFSANMFNATTGNYSYAEVGFVNKAAMEKCKKVTPTFFSQLSVGSVLVDTVNPVDTETPTLQDPGVEYLVNAFNMNGDPFGDDCLFTACHGFTVWAYDPATGVLSGVFEDQTIPADNYISPPNADQPICTQCVETIDTRVTATPVYSVGSGTGLISFSIDTGANNNIGHTVPGILWGQLEPALSGGQVFAAGMFQSGYLVFAGDQDASFGAMMQDKNGRMVMVFDTMSATLNPSIMYTTRLASDPLGSLRVPKFLFTGPTPTFDSRWGDFEAASYDGFSTNHMWVASQYSIGDWATFIARLT